MRYSYVQAGAEIALFKHDFQVQTIYNVKVRYDIALRLMNPHQLIRYLPTIIT